MTEYLISIKIEALEEGGYLATSDTLQGFIAQGRTIAETMEIAQDVARKLVESYIEHVDPLPQNMLSASFVFVSLRLEGYPWRLPSTQVIRSHHVVL